MSKESVSNELCREILVSHYEQPRNKEVLISYTGKALAENPFCGDHVEIFINSHDEIIKNASFLGNGCVLSQASASILISKSHGHNLSDVLAMCGNFKKIMYFQAEPLNEFLDDPEWASLTAMRHSPARIKCVCLACEAMIAAIVKAT